jgi:sigma-B regulation protein RsbU (phosphoserine phosphatase)
MRTIMRTHLQMHGEPGNALATACRLFHPLIPSDRFMTGVYARLGDDGCFDWASAGHHPPIWMHADGKIEPMERSSIGLPLATMPDEKYASVHWKLKVGDRILLFTDGLVEARNRAGDVFGRDRLEGTVRDHRNDSPATFVDNLLSQAGDHLAGTEFEDDFTILAIERVD